MGGILYGGGGMGRGIGEGRGVGQGEVPGGVYSSCTGMLNNLRIKALHMNLF